MSFLKSLDNNSSKFSEPFDHWELNKPLTDDQIKEIINAEIDNPIEHNINSVSYTHLTLPTKLAV